MTLGMRARDCNSPWVWAVASEVPQVKHPRAPWCPFSPRDPTGPQVLPWALQRGFSWPDATPPGGTAEAASVTPLTSHVWRDSVERGLCDCGDLSTALPKGFLSAWKGGLRWPVLGQVVALPSVAPRWGTGALSSPARGGRPQPDPWGRGPRASLSPWAP